ncbi:MAG: bifunctional oligoribonuclease/PAP phosphatase NrnA [Candidatus Eisenbacteria bacterium]|uniref:Bifunctional oligoribonuclease/PAP phosphatase NrnA n=1 Tax=Eiseniibacteriota bacterium TaxID=2212470 RepID=A0A538T8K9_UNCEI|nr:MAG: bifunctional oligoribonuclease/PAP phosphatase NrnA [Candidatus Eisenbacteria bacterium]
MNDVTLEGLEAFLAGREEFLVTAHIDPDGDAVGSCLGLKLALDHMGKTAEVVLDSPVPAALLFLPAASTIRRPDHVQKKFDSAFVLDSSSLDRTGSVPERCLNPGAKIAVFDHHWGNDGFGDIRLVNPEASATAELVYDVIDLLHIPISPEIAECLYAGILSDTGGFRYANTSSRTLRVAARLVERGARAPVVAEALYATKTAPSLRILGLALASLETRSGGRIGAMTISRDMFERAGATPEDADGIVQYAKALAGARVGVLVQEVAPNEIRASLRSDGTVDVNEVASLFGGGGHRNAAGLRVRGDLERVRNDLYEALDRAMNGGPPPSAG